MSFDIGEYIYNYARVNAGDDLDAFWKTPEGIEFMDDISDETLKMENKVWELVDKVSDRVEKWREDNE